jgi:N-acetylneuraminic acid mutarotase
MISSHFRLVAVAMGAVTATAACDSTVRVAATSNGGQGGASASSSSGGGASVSSSSGGGALNDGGVDAMDGDVIEPCTGQGVWFPMETKNEPHCRERFVSAWSGTDLLIFGGGHNSLGLYQGFEDGARYDVNANSWTPLPLFNMPIPEFAAASAWTGSKWIVWGGSGGGSASPLNSFGALYDPMTDAWTLTSAMGAPTGRVLHTAIWSGSEMIVWGGSNVSVASLGDGARYSPGVDSWIPVNPIGAPAPRYSHVAIWTGSEMIVWGGRNVDEAFSDGAAYDPKTDQWRPISSIGAPSARYEHAIVWTGTEMIVWGGASTNPFMLLGDGARYDPKTDTWSTLATTGAPTPRQRHSAVWIGTQMIVWGGGVSSPDWTRTNTGGIYDLQSDTWAPTSMCDAPVRTEGHTAVWTGSEMIVWGGNGCAHGHRFVP